MASGKSRKSSTAARAFGYQTGVRLHGTALVCDAPRTAGALSFISHAGVVAAGLRARSPISAAQVLLTQTCSNLLGAAGYPLGARALVANYGRPFVLGLLRVELFPSGVAPGAASLFCESPRGHVVYAGPMGLGEPGTQTLRAEIRPAAALCLDATFAACQNPFAPVPDALDAVVAFTKQALAAGRQPVLLTAVDSLTLDAARALIAAGVSVRAHTALIRLADVYRLAGLEDTPLQRFSGKLTPNEALLLPLSARVLPIVGRLRNPAVVITAALALAQTEVAKLRADAVIPVGNFAGQADLLSYVKATGAKEVAALNDLNGGFSAQLRAAGVDAYSLGPPAQLTLFAA